MADPRLIDTESEALNQAPGKCLVSGRSEGEFVDTGVRSPYHNPHVYLHRGLLEELAAKHCGMVPAAEVEERYSALETQLADQAEELDKLATLDAAIEGLGEALSALTDEKEEETDEGQAQELP